LTLAAAACRLPRLSVPGDEVFDEVYHAKSALQYLEGQPPVDWVHPPTSKLLIAVGIWALGYDSLGWRLMPALAGILLAPVFFFLARRVLATERAAVLASVLLLCDGVYLVQSRIAMTNIFAVLFQVATALFLVRSATSEPLATGDMLAAGAALGLALSTRWTSLFAAAFLGSAFLVARRGRILREREVVLVIVSLLCLPAGLYALSYVPYMHIKFPLAGWTDLWRVLKDLLMEQTRVYRYHADLRAEHPYFSVWYTWPWLYRPTLYYFHIDEGTEAVRGILALGNPALWWLSIPATLWALATGIRDHDARRIFTGAGFLGLYLPWGLSPRTLNFSHYLFEAIPYACLSLGALLDACWDGQRRPVARGYVAVVVLLFLFFYPFLTAMPIPHKIFYASRWPGTTPWWWFPTWI